MKRYYVYTLTDPRDGAVFYVGKGCGSRINAHEREANTVDSPKCRRIRDIWAAGQSVAKSKIAYFASERAAYAYEARLIAELPGLTNGGATAKQPIPWQRQLVRWAISAARGELFKGRPWARAIATVLAARADAIIQRHGPYGA